MAENEQGGGSPTSSKSLAGFEKNRPADLTRSLSQAREAFKTRDVRASWLAHFHGGKAVIKEDGSAVISSSGSVASSPNGVGLEATLLECFQHGELHSTQTGDFIKSIVFGGLDGIVTIFAMVAGCIGAHLSPSAIIVVGLGNLLADALSMGFGEYQGAKAELEYFQNEFKREKWELETCPEGEKQEMIELYTTKYGFAEADAKSLVEISYKYPIFFLSHMMVEELGLIVPEEDSPSPPKKGLVMFLSFISFGLVPLLSYVICLKLFFVGGGEPTTSNMPFIICCATVGMTLFVLGFAKGAFTDQNKIKSGAVMALNGLFASFVAFAVGSVLESRIVHQRQ